MRSKLFVSYLIATLTLLHWPAIARDRPGTPNNPSAWECDQKNPMAKPNLCFTFRNTAGSDKVHFEIEMNAMLLDRSRQLCSLSFTAGSPDGTGCIVEGRNGFDLGNMSLGIEVPNLEFDTQYCFRVRTRRADDGVVSELWSAEACAQTRKQLPPPPPPEPPKFDVHFLGSQWIDGKAYPEKLAIAAGAFTPTVIIGWNTDLRFARPMSLVNGHYEYHIDLATPQLMIYACAQNISGTACSFTQVDGKNQMVFYGPPPTGAVKQTKRPVGGPPEDPRWNDWIGVWDAHTSQGVAFKVTLTRDGDRLMGKFEDAPEPQYGGVFIQSGTSLGLIYQFTYQQPTTGGSGSGGFVLNEDGKTFNGLITTNDNPPVKVTWQGHKISNTPK